MYTAVRLPQNLINVRCANQCMIFVAADDLQYVAELIHGLTQRQR